MAPLTIYLIDDNFTFLAAAVDFLEKHAQEVTIIGTATNGLQALEQCAILHPDVILVDLKMPDLSGLDLLPQLRAALPQAWIIVLSMLDTPEYRQAALQAGADEFVPKAGLTAALLPATRRSTDPHA